MNFSKTIQTQDGELVVCATTLRIRTRALQELAALRIRAAEDPACKVLVDGLGEEDEAEGVAVRLSQVVRWGSRFPNGMVLEDLLDFPLSSLGGLLRAGREVDAEADSFRGAPGPVSAGGGGGGQPDRLE